MKTANANEEMLQALHMAAKGNQAASIFLVAWHEYCHEWDDLVDGFWPDADQLLRVASHAIDLYSLPYYLRHLSQLKPLVKHTTAMYLCATKWEHSPDRRRRVAADIIRHTGLDVVYAVAEIEGGWEWRIEVMEAMANRVIDDRNEED